MRPWRTAVLASAAGCGSRASDADVIAALEGGPAAGNSAPSEPAVTSSDIAATNGGAGSTVAEVPAAGAGQSPTGGVTGATTPTATTGGSGAKGTDKAPGGTVAAVSTSTGPATKSVVLLGQVGPYSGVLGAVTSYSPRVLAAWVAYTNAHGGLNGHPVKVIVGDDQGDPATAMTLTRRMVESDHVLAFVGNCNVFGFAQIEQ